MQRYTAHATMRNGLCQRVEVTASCQVEAMRKLFKLYRALSVTNPKPH